MTDLEIYDKLSRPDPSALKQIQAGRLKGKTDINPQWRYKAMTEQFGLCGVGWKYTIDRQWIEKGEGVEMMAFVNVSVYVKHNEEWSDPIPGTGGSMLVASERNGPYNSDEAFKMATTDALSVALKFIGVAAAIYAGQWDGTKYIGDNEKSPEQVLAEWCAYVEGATNADGLRKCFEEAVAAYKGNPQALVVITASKDKRKKELGL